MGKGVVCGLVALGGIGLGAGGLAYAALWPRSRLFGPVLVAGDNPDEVALTFDDGPNGDTTLRLLEILARHKARATFFLIGRFVRQQPRIARIIANEGHLVGNHTMTHPWLPVQSAERIRQELGGCKALLEDVLGAPISLFRPPHGARRPYVIEHARDLGMTTVQWNVTGNDWKGFPPEKLVQHLQVRLRRNRAKGRASNVLLHDGSDGALGISRAATLYATDRLLHELRERTVTLDRWI